MRGPVAVSIESAVLLSLGVAVLYVSPFSHRAFEADKVLLVRLLGAAACLGLLRLGWIWRASGARQIADEWKPILVASGATLVALCVSVAFSANVSTSTWGSYIRRDGAVTQLSLLALFAAAAVLSQDGARRLKLMRWMVALSVPVSLYGVLQIVVPSLTSMPDMGPSRGPSTLGSGLAVASWVAPVIPVALLLVVRERQWSLRQAIATLTVCLQFLIIILSGSRGPTLAVLAGGAIMVGVSGKLFHRPRLTYVALGALLLGLISAVAVGTTVNQRHNSVARLAHTFDLDHPSTQGRLATWSAFADATIGTDGFRDKNGALDPWRRLRPIVGFGPETQGTFLPRLHSRDLAVAEKRLHRVDRAHNWFWDRYFTQGWLGVGAGLGWLTVLFSVLTRALGFRAEGRLRLIRVEGAMCLAAIVGAGSASLVFGASTMGLGLGLGAVFGWLIWVFASKAPPKPTGDALVRVLTVLLLLGSLLVHFIELQVGVPTIANQLTNFLVAGLVLGTVLPPKRPAPQVRDHRNAVLISGAVLGLLLSALCQGPVGGRLGALFEGTSPLEVLLVLAIATVFWISATGTFGRPGPKMRFPFFVLAAALTLGPTLLLGSRFGAQAPMSLLALAKRLELHPLGMAIGTSLVLVSSILIVGFRRRRESASAIALALGPVGALALTSAAALGSDITFKLAESQLAAVGNSRALVLFERAVTLSPNESQYRKRLANRHYHEATRTPEGERAKHLRAALQHTRADSELRPYHLSPVLDEGRLWLFWATQVAPQKVREARALQARGSLLNAAAMAPTVATPFHYLTRYFLTVENKPRLAVHTALAAYDRAPTYPMSSWLVATSLLKLSLTQSGPERTQLRQQAIVPLESALEAQDPTVPQKAGEMHLLLAQLNAETGEHSTSLEHLRRASQLLPMEKPRIAALWQSLFPARPAPRAAPQESEKPSPAKKKP